MRGPVRGGTDSGAGPPHATHELVVAVDPHEVDAASGWLWSLGVSAVAEHLRPDGTVALVADEPPVSPEVLAAGGPGGWVVEVRPVVDDGSAGWEPHARVVRVGRRLVVRPAWLTEPDDLASDAVVVVVDPQGTFGHGNHPTTRSVLAELDRWADTRSSEGSGGSVLDVGCGSGVLAVAAARLGADRVVAVDVDPDAVTVTQAAAEANRVTDRVTAEPTPVAEVAGAFDLVLANLGAGLLDDLAGDLLARVAPGGTLVVSGLLERQLEATLAALGAGPPEQVVDDGWATAVLRPGATAPTRTWRR